MKKEFSSSWIASRQPRKQRKYVYNAPKHIRRNFFSARLSDELTKKYSTRNLPVRTGDKVKIVRGQYKKHEGKVERIDAKRIRVFVTGAERLKSDGSKSLYPIHPSNLIIQELTSDKKRLKFLERRKGASK